jgi:hypothetical protein
MLADASIMDAGVTGSTRSDDLTCVMERITLPAKKGLRGRTGTEDDAVIEVSVGIEVEEGIEVSDRE